MQVVDPHIHLWNPQTHHYPWIAKPGRTFMGDYDAITGKHEVSEFLADAGEIEVLKTVHVEAAHDPADPLAETIWLQSLANAPGSRGIPHGIVAAANLADPNIERLLAAHAAYPNVRGIRQILNVHPDPFYDYVGRHFMREPEWRQGFKLLEKYGLSFDLQIYPAQMPEAAAVAHENPDTPLILNHSGMFADRSSVAGWRAWRDGMRMLAACPNVSVKISGFGMFDHHWTVESLRPYVLETIDTFGAERCMFASNFPVDRLYSTYTAVWKAFAEIVSGASETEKSALFSENAQRIYRI
jgi:predicted TIM-barrel fold metal-dependent hydrolase